MTVRRLTREGRSTRTAAIAGSADLVGVVAAGRGVPVTDLQRALEVDRTLRRS